MVDQKRNPQFMLDGQALFGSAPLSHRRYVSTGNKLPNNTIAKPIETDIDNSITLA